MPADESPAMAAEGVEELIQDAPETLPEAADTAPETIAPESAPEPLPQVAGVAAESTAPEPVPEALPQVADIAPESPVPEPAPETLPQVADVAPEPTDREPAGSFTDELAGLPAATQSPAPAERMDDPQRQSADAIPVAASEAQEDIAGNAEADGPELAAAPTISAPAPRPFTVTSVPAGAAIRFADGSGPYVAGMMLAPGGYRILAELPGHSLWEGTLAHGDGSVDHEVVLAALPTEFSDPLASGGAGPVMVRVAPGSFRMGCASGRRCFSNELPVLEVNVQQGYAISKHEVTVSDYGRFVEASGYLRAETEGGGAPPEHPVANVDWRDAEAYTQWLSAETGRHYRLPTESEWEFAARAGSAAAYSWGDDPAQGSANCSGCGRGSGVRGTTPVGSFPANAWGLHDMHGNLWEWVLNCPVPSRRVMQPGTVHEADVDCRRRVRRGGSWSHSARRARSASRDITTAALRSPNTGFRVLLVNP